MSLYDYTLYVVREAERGDLFRDAMTRGLVSVDRTQPGPDPEGTCMGGRVRCVLRQSRNAVDPSLPFDILTIALDDRTLEALLAAQPDEFRSWLWSIADALQPVCFFMPGGSDMTYLEKGEPVRTLMFTRLPQVVTSGEIVGVHPIMYFAERMAKGALCEKARGAPWTLVEHRSGVGCLLLLVNRGSTGALDIMELGSNYDELRAYFDAA